MADTTSAPMITSQPSAPAEANDYARRLVDELVAVLEKYDPINPSEGLRAVDAFFAYRLLLGRNPHPTAELPRLFGQARSFREFLTELLNAPDFAHSSGFFPPHRFLMSEVEGFRFWFNTSDREMGVAMGLGLYEPVTVNLLKRLTRPTTRCLDIGAQTGFYTCLIVSRIGASGFVHAFEPMPPSYELLVRNVAENAFGDRVRTYPYACSNMARTLNASMVSNMYVVGEVQSGTPVQTQSICIDDVIDEPIDLIKIDIEGHEPAALAGMSSLLARSKPIIVSEANEYWLRTCSNSSAGEYVALLNALGYTVYDVEHLDAPLDSRSLALDILATINVLAVPMGTSVAAVLQEDRP